MIEASMFRLFNQRAGGKPNPQFVDIYGWKWQGNFGEYFRTPDMQAAAILCGIGACADMVSGQGNPGVTMFTGMFMCLWAKGLSFKLTHDYLQDRKFGRDGFCASDYAIDRLGQSPPPECIDILMRQTLVLSRVHLGAVCFFGAFAALFSQTELRDVFTQINAGKVPSGKLIRESLIFTIPLFSSVESYVRARRLLRNEYSFCGNPPMVESRVTQGVKSDEVAVNAQARKRHLRLKV